MVDLSLHACSNVTLEYVAVLDECSPFGRDSSLNFFVIFADAVYLSLVNVALNVFYLTGV